jgi:SAM-dependent methyltransferase
MESEFYDAEYYLTGPTSGKSNYVDYSWKPDLTLPMADWLKRVLHIKDGDTVLDFGCARGYLVKALRMRGVNAFGYDSSEWAIQNCDEGVKGYVSNALPDERFDHIIAKDVFEHIRIGDLTPILATLVEAMRKSMLIIVPLIGEDGDYLRHEDRSDPSHAIRWGLQDWLDFAHRWFGYQSDLIIAGSWHYPGLKPASSEVPKSCGFIQFTRA